MLNAVAQLPQDVARDVGRGLSDEVDADTFGADQLHNLRDLLEQLRRSVVEEHVRFIEEEDYLRLLGIAGLRQRLEELRHHPQHERAVHHRGIHQLVGSEDVDVAAAVLVRAEPVHDVQRRFAEEHVAALLFEADQRTDDGADALLRHVAVRRDVVVNMVAHVVEHGAKILDVEEQEARVVRNLEDDGQDVGLRVIESHQLREQQRSHLGDGGAERVSRLAVHVPESRRIRVITPDILEPELRNALLHVLRILARLAHTGQVAFGVCQEHRHAGVGERLRQYLQRDGLAGAGRAGNQPVAIGHLRYDAYAFVVALAHPYQIIRIHIIPPRRCLSASNC